MIVVVDYGAGNLKSVSNALDSMLVDYTISDKPEDIENADKIILPGVGNFGHAMKTLKEKKLVEPLIKRIKEGTPYLGICLGLQLLFEKSEESPNIKGFGILKGEVKKLKGKFKIPHIGWNSIKKVKDSELLEEIKEDTFFYFVHSFVGVPKDESIILTTTEYGKDFVSGIEQDNITAFQFHPEKSGKTGVAILRRFCEL
ncbi:imidazole glycerol phosphate synthase subunit HisH [Nanoarchaeota archaeon]